MSVAEAAKALAKINTEKANIYREIDRVQNKQSKGFVGLVKLSVYQVDGLPEDATFHIDYELADEDASSPVTESLTQKALKEPVEILLKSKDYYIDINCNVQLGEVDEEVKPEGEGETEEEKLDVVPVAPHSVYKTRVEFSDVPDDVEFREELEALCGGERLAGKLPILHVKASYDSFEMMIASKERELLQLTEAYEEAELALQEAEETQALLAGRKSHHTAPSTTAAAEEEEEEEDVTEEPVAADETEEAGRVEELFDEPSAKQSEAPAAAPATPSATEPAAPTEAAPAPAAAKESTAKPAKKSTAKKSTEKKSTTKKTAAKKKTVVKDVDEDEDDYEEEKKGGTVAKKGLFSNWSEVMVNLAQQCLGLGLQHRNWFILGLAAFGIYSYGDYASV